MDLTKYTVEELRDKFQDFNIENEEFVPLYFRGQKTDYQISKYGNILGKRGKILKWTLKAGRQDRRAEASVSIYPPPDKHFVEGDWIFNKTNRHVSVYVHRQVALHFLPFPEHLPAEIKDDWDKLSDASKYLIQNCLQVDHVDGNTFNPRWDNLEWVTPQENSRRSVLMKNNS